MGNQRIVGDTHSLAFVSTWRNVQHTKDDQRWNVEAIQSWKSSLLNDFIARDLLPVGVVPVTAI